jgi:SAM-dependent methyltransferase
MKIPWMRRNFGVRRILDRLLLDPPDALFRLLTGRRDQPPYSLRAFVGGAKNFDEAGRFFLEDFFRMQLFSRCARLLEIGCGRVALSLASDGRVDVLEVSYFGMDVDHTNIKWCDQHITKRNSRFRFYHADCYNSSYNPHGSIAADSYSFPHADESQDLIVLTSVLTHVLPNELTHYLSEISRLLAPGGMVYTSLFLYRSSCGAPSGSGRHKISFPVLRGHYAVNREDFPTNAVAYEECYFRDAVRGAGLRILEPVRFGIQDIVLLSKQADPTEKLHLGEGWHQLEKGCWRWTKRTCVAEVPRPSGAASTLRFRFTVVEALLGNLGLRLRATAAGVRLPDCSYWTVGEHLYVQDIPPSALNGPSIPIHFEIENGYSAVADDLRELGVQVMFWTCGEGMIRRPLCPISITEGHRANGVA